jgi:membrane protein
MGLDGATAAVVRQLIAPPPDAGEPVTIVGLVLLVFSVLGFARSLQRTFEAAWEPPRSGLRGYGPGLLGAAVFIGELGTLVFLAATVHAFSVKRRRSGRRARRGGGVGVVAGAAAARRRPGAVARPPARRDRHRRGQAVVMALASLTLRPVLIDQAQRFGMIGVAFALVTALTVFGVLLVLGAVLGPVVAGRVSPAQPRATA